MATWHLTKEQNRISKKLEAIKNRYAREVVRFIKTLPKEHHQIAFHLACDPSYEVVWQLSRNVAKKHFQREESDGKEI